MQQCILAQRFAMEDGDGWVREISKDLQLFLPTAPTWDGSLVGRGAIYEYRVLAENYDDDYFEADVLIRSTDYRTMHRIETKHLLKEIQDTTNVNYEVLRKTKERVVQTKATRTAYFDLRTSLVRCREHAECGSKLTMYSWSPVASRKAPLTMSNASCRVCFCTGHSNLSCCATPGTVRVKLRANRTTCTRARLEDL